MAFGNKQSGKFFTILNGKFCQRVPDGTIGAVQRKNKLDKLVSEIFHDTFTGKLVGVKTQDGGAYGKNWIFSFEDNAEVYHLQLSYSNSFAVSILKMLPNIDLTKEMTVTPSVKEVDGKNQSSLFINQGGKAIKHAYTKDAPNGLPQLRELTVKGQKVWDDTDRLAFLEKMVAEKITPQLVGKAPAAEPVDAATAAIATESAVEDSGF